MAISLVTALNPKIGYARAAEIAKRAITSGKTIREAIAETGMFTAKEIEDLMDARLMTEYNDDPQIGS